MLKMEIRLDEQKIQLEQNIRCRAFTRHWNGPLQSIDCRDSGKQTSLCLSTEAVMQKTMVRLVLLSYH